MSLDRGVVKTQITVREYVDNSLATGKQLQLTAQEKLEQGLVETEKAWLEWQAAIAALGASGVLTANALKDLPRTAQALAQEMPKIAKRMQTAGVRVGEIPRSDADVMAMFNKIPGTSKLGANERDIRTFLSDKHGSHIFPHSKGGNNGAENVVWELGTHNIGRGAELMTGGEQLYIRFYNAVDSILKNSTTIAQLGLAATGTAILTQAVVTALSYTLDLYRGDITAEEFRDKIVNAAVTAGIATPIFFLILVAAIALFPEIVLILSAPAVVAGFNVLFGVGIALPIIQSIVRHLEAGGFGDAAKAQYEMALQQGQEVLHTSSESVQWWWNQLLSDADWQTEIST
ncbi:MAG: HNH endonuclease [Cyanobacteria bacterium P01_H01_bin.153]